MPRRLLLEGRVRSSVGRSGHRPTVVLDDGAYAAEVDADVDVLKRIAATVLAVVAELERAPSRGELVALPTGDGVAWWEYCERPGSS